MKRHVTLLMAMFLCAWTGTASAAVKVNAGLSDVIAAVEKSFQQDSSGQMPISAFSADFFQRTTLTRERREMRGDGRLSVSMPTGSTPLMFRFEYFRPSQQEIVSDGRSMWIYHPENREVILSDVSFLYNFNSYDPNRNNAVNFLQGLGRISRDFQINFAAGMTDMAGNYVLELNPRRPMLNTRRILLVVSRECVIARIAASQAAKTTTNDPFNVQDDAPVPLARQKSSQTKALNANIAPLGGQHLLNLFPILSTTVEDQEGNTTTLEFTNIRINNRFPISEFTFIVPGNVQVIRPSERNLPR